VFYLIEMNYYFCFELTVVCIEDAVTIKSFIFSFAFRGRKCKGCIKWKVLWRTLSER
jgi:hypothetical protein